MSCKGALETAYEGSKRFVDLTVAGTGLVVLAPAMTAIAALVKLDSPGPALFRQERLGRHGSTFSLLKFRTMKHGTGVVIGSDYTVVNPANDDRVTRVGAWLRRTSLDELPQLINVIRGEMSLVGPRPDLETGLAVYSERQRRRLEVKPGLTGLAQTSGRNLLSAEEKWEFDVRYVESRGFWTDASILASTVRWVLTGKGVYKG